MPSDMVEEAGSLTSQDLCLVRIGALTSNISLATMAPRSHHLDMGHLRTADYQRPRVPNNFVPRLTCPAPARVLPTRPPASCSDRGRQPQQVQYNKIYVNGQITK